MRFVDSRQDWETLRKSNHSYVNEFTDHRPQALLTGFTGCLLALVIEIAMLGKYVAVPVPNIAGEKVAIFAIMFFVFFYGFFIDAASFIYSSEIYPTNIRARGMAMATFTYFAACIVSGTRDSSAVI